MRIIVDAQSEDRWETPYLGSGVDDDELCTPILKNTEVTYTHGYGDSYEESSQPPPQVSDIYSVRGASLDQEDGDQEAAAWVACAMRALRHWAESNPE